MTAPGSPDRNRVDPKKLLLGKWTAVVPRDREKHFLVVKVLDPDVAGGAPTKVHLEAVLSRRVRTVPWRELEDPAVWKQGWVQVS
ncbi:MAG: TIGR02450 family Trp-rich protein [bacterium]